MRHKLSAQALRPACWTLAIGLGVSLPMAGLAQITAQAPGGDVIAHRVVAGDTLEQLAQRYLGDRQLWSALQNHNRVANPHQLRPGSVLEIPSRLLQAAVASVEFVQGDARSWRPASPDGKSQPAAPRQALQRGQTLSEGDALELAPNAFVSIRLADGSLVRVQAQSDVQLRQMRRKGRAGSLQSVLDMRAGSIEASVPPQSSGERRLEIRTPVASTSVRGTHFLVQADTDGRTVTAVDQGSVAVQAGAAGQALLQPGQGVHVSEQGALGETRALLTAPDLSGLPQVAQDANWISLPLPAMDGVKGYQILLARDAQLREVVRSGRFEAFPARLPIVDDGDYVVSVRPWDSQGIPGRASQRALKVKTQPVAPLHQSPAPQATLGRGQQGLNCTAVTGVAHYRIQVTSQDTGFAPAPTLDLQDLSSCALPASALSALPTGPYLWRVASVRLLADGQADQGPYSAPQGFVLADAPAQPSADAMDLGGSSGAGSSTIYWSGEPGQRYRLMVASDAEFKQPLLDTWLHRSEWSTEALPPGRYYLRMQIEDANGLRSSLSAPRQFQTGSWVTDGSGQMLNSGFGERLLRQ